MWHQATITRAMREKQNGYNSVLIWFTGLSGAGKSTIAHALEKELHQLSCHTYVLDGDNVRHGLSKDLGFSNDAREENMRRVGEVASLFLDAGIITLSAFISPFRVDRELVRNLVGPENFIEVYCHCTLEECEKRDVKGLYKKARQGVVNNFTGISSPYEAPEDPDIILNTVDNSVDQCVVEVMKFLNFKYNLLSSDK